jgi:hypothetical protein
MDVSPARRHTLAQYLLSAFVLWQFGFLLASNIVPFFPHGVPEEGELSDSRSAPAAEADSHPLQNTIDATSYLTDRWAHLTGQIQAWWLFAPGFPRQATFPVVELRWDDPERTSQPGATEATRPPMRLHSALEPEDPQSYCHPPGSYDRLFHYEMRLGSLMTLWDEQVKDAELYRAWEEAVRIRVSRQWKSIRAYLRWRMQQFQQERPEVPTPKQAILVIRIYRTRSAGEAGRPKPIEKALARWLPRADDTDEFLPVEMCEPRSDTFVRLPRNR